nr:ribonuclease H-like domain-containing protein [Tanacetum cinerariifolium]
MVSKGIVSLDWIGFDSECSCEGAKNLKEHAHLLRLMQFLMGLDDMYSVVRSQILASDPIPNVKSAFATLSRDESYRNSFSTTKNAKAGPFAFAVKSSNSGHTIDRFHELVGYPPSYKRNSNQGSVNSVSTNDCKTDQSKSTSHTLTADQYQRLMSSLSISGDSSKGSASVARFNSKVPDGGWLGHPGDQVLTVLKMILKMLIIMRVLNLEVCHKAKKTRESFSISDHKTSSLGDLVHLDVQGPYRITSRDGYMFFLTIVDDYTRAVWMHEPNELYDDRGVNTDSNNKYVPDISTHNPSNSTVDVDVSKEGVRTTDTDIPSEVDSSLNTNTTPSRKDTIRNEYATETIVSEGIQGNNLDENYDSKGEDLEEDVYMNLPEGYGDKNDKRVCKLVKSLYGLKQAPRKWNEKLSSVLYEQGFFQSKNDFSLFTKHENDIVLILLVYVDDIIVTGNNLDEINKKYCNELLSDFGMLACKPCSTPIELNPDSKKLNDKFGNDEKLCEITQYQILVGKLIYLTMTRPDIAYAVHCLSQVMHSPMKSHPRLTFRVLRYLKKEPGLGITIKKGMCNSLNVFVDSDWAKCKVTRRSLTGYCVFLGKNLVSWKSKKQGVVSRSSTEAEYRAMCSVCCDVIWIRKILTYLKVDVDLPIEMNCNNNFAIQISLIMCFIKEANILKSVFTF